MQEAVGRLSLAESAEGQADEASQGERRRVERPLPVWEAEGVKLELMDLPLATEAGSRRS